MGGSLETLIYHELRAFNGARRKHRAISYYRTAAGTEIDFVVETRKRSPDTSPHVVCMEVKLAAKWNRKWERAMRDLAEMPSITVDRMIGVYMGSEKYHFSGLDVLPVRVFLQELHAGNLF